MGDNRKKSAGDSRSEYKLGTATWVQIYGIVVSFIAVIGGAAAGLFEQDKVLRDDFNNLRGDYKELRGEYKELRADVNARFGSVDNRLLALDAKFENLRKDLSEDITDLKVMQARILTAIEGLNQPKDAGSSAPAASEDTHTKNAP